MKRDRAGRPFAQRGATLAPLLVLLVLMSLLGAAGLRQAVSTEHISHAARAAELAAQAAEIGLRHCEALVLAGDAPAAQTPPRWPDPKAWDRQSLGARTVPLHLLHPPESPPDYHRAPECLAERTSAAPEPTTASASTTATVTTATFTITARGFGPEVPAQPLQGAPAGTEVWLQSQLVLAESPGSPGSLRARQWRQIQLR